MDWAGDWIYYSMGDASTEGSKTWRRTNVVTGEDQAFVTLVTSAIGRFHVSASGTRAVIRGANYYPPGEAHIFAYDMVRNDGILDLSRATPDIMSCGEAFSPDGLYFTDGWLNHEGFDVRSWDDISIAESFVNADINELPPTANSGPYEARNRWSRNDPQWICLHLGWQQNVTNGGNMVLFNWVKDEKVVVSQNEEAARVWTGCGDFWVEHQAPLVLSNPEDASVIAGQEAIFITVATSVKKLSYQWRRNDVSIQGATSAILGFVASIEDEGARYTCAISNGTQEVVTEPGYLTVTRDPNGAQLVSAVVQGREALLLTFDKSIDPKAACDETLFSLSDGALVLSSEQLSPVTIRLSLTELTCEQSYTLRIDALVDASGHVLVAEAEVVALCEVHNQAPSVELGPSQSTLTDMQMMLIPIVTDDGLPQNTLNYQWSEVEGPAAAHLSTPQSERTAVSFPQAGSYTMRLVVDDGDRTGQDELIIDVSEAPAVVILSPNGGEVLTVGESAFIEWSAVGVNDVVLRYSTNNGQSWVDIVPSIDDTSPHWKRLPWTVPDEPSDECRVMIEGYFGQGAVISENPFSIVRAVEPEPTDGVNGSKDGDEFSGCRQLAVGRDKRALCPLQWLSVL
ncbi:MAG: hypothetical protein MUC50_04550 [Myxococcota bacterium]|jgi:hypothetical protein|nr:hypothetical protein [Myxococcota bacterium]